MQSAAAAIDGKLCRFSSTAGLLCRKEGSCPKRAVAQREEASFSPGRQQRWTLIAPTLRPQTRAVGLPEWNSGLPSRTGQRPMSPAARLQPGSRGPRAVPALFISPSTICFPHPPQNPLSRASNGLTAKPCGPANYWNGRTRRVRKLPIRCWRVGRAPVASLAARADSMHAAHPRRCKPARAARKRLQLPMRGTTPATAPRAHPGRDASGPLMDRDLAANLCPMAQHGPTDPFVASWDQTLAETGCGWDDGMGSRYLGSPCCPYCVYSVGLTS